MIGKKKKSENMKVESPSAVKIFPVKSANFLVTLNRISFREKVGLFTKLNRFFKSSTLHFKANEHDKYQVVPKMWTKNHMWLYYSTQFPLSCTSTWELDSHLCHAREDFHNEEIIKSTVKQIADLLTSHEWLIKCAILPALVASMTRSSSIRNM